MVGVGRVVGVRGEVPSVAGGVGVGTVTVIGEKVRGLDVESNVDDVGVAEVDDSEVGVENSGDGGASRDTELPVDGVEGVRGDPD